MEYVVLASSTFKNDAKEEIKTVFKRAKFKDLFEGNFLVSVSDSKKMFGLGKKSVFIQNLFPVVTKFEGSDISSIEAKLEKSSIKKLKLKAFRIETINHGSEINSRDLEVALGSRLEKRGYKVDFKKPKQILCVLSLRNEHYIGVVDEKDWVYKHFNIAKRFSKEKNRINRAQFKLVEAIERFKIELSGGIAIDIGASPGGWTKVLVDKGYLVYAIDPAKLEKSVKKNKKVIHVEKRVEDFKPDFKADLITNDININPEESAKIIEGLSSYLKPKKYVLMTLKLTRKKPREILTNVKKILKSYKLVNVKHLFQNRQEITILIQKK